VNEPAYSPQNTRTVAERMAEDARYLNYASGPHRDTALQYPSDVHAVTGDLAMMASRLPQLLGQLAAWLQDQSAAGKISVDQGSVIETVADASRWLQRANDGAAALSYGLDQAHQAMAAMSGTEGDSDG
jgi:hypothetical protein